ncbi:hypothetical protein BU26DRAFT_567376 [Trematosphaeria pertusa]|uniref:Uncharacterized protein n=1 Tax=Trematosphaeria pertusa TaxID=390896 RepID=A0A6A6I699_9PLEO|nr:uncharacterized protein BU26DRAFT_567376 [Trematosphaeria pertusa]KAF2245857.1 hypothetical protein BU26DRAFT_567376 [Trematosphaeria pertusa]
MAEIIEGVNTRRIYKLTVFCIVISALLGIAYNAITGEAGDGFSIASYLITALGFFVAVVAAGEWMGLESLDSFSETDLKRGKRYRVEYCEM